MAVAIRSVVILCVLATFIGTMEACNFSSSCTEISFSDNIMSARCRTSADEVVRASINVNDCVGNNNGELDCSSNFLRTCTRPEYNGLTLRAVCRKDDGTTMVSNRALDNCIQNVEGKLQCC